MPRLPLTSSFLFSIVHFRVLEGLSNALQSKVSLAAVVEASADNVDRNQPVSVHVESEA